MNSDLKQLHDQLISQHQSLYEQLDTAPDAAAAKTILTEMQELLHRVDIVQGLLFRETTTALKNQLSKVNEADQELTKALQAAKTSADIINGVGKFLTVVDKAIDLAKRLAPLVGL